MSFTRRQLDIAASRLINNFSIEVLSRSSRYETINDVLAEWSKQTRLFWAELPLDIEAGTFEYLWPSTLIQVKEVFYRGGSGPIDDLPLRFVPYDRYPRQYEGGVGGPPNFWTARGARSADGVSPDINPLIIGPTPTADITAGLRIVGHVLPERLDETSTEVAIAQPGQSVDDEGDEEEEANDLELPYPESHRQGIIYGIALQYAMKDAENQFSNGRIPFLFDAFNAKLAEIMDDVNQPGDDPTVVGGDYFRHGTPGEDSGLNPDGWVRFRG